VKFWSAVGTDSMGNRWDLSFEEIDALEAVIAAARADVEEWPWPFPPREGTTRRALHDAVAALDGEDPTP
jgi:hypothetical protein